MNIHDTALKEVMLLRRSELSLWLASLIGRYQLRKIFQSGLPPSPHAPFLFLLTRKLGSEEYQVVSRIEGLRLEMIKRTNEFVGVFTEARLLSATGMNSSSTNSHPLTN